MKKRRYGKNGENKKHTPNGPRSLALFLSHISKKKKISPEREVELVIRIRNNDKLALEELVVANLRAVVSIAKEYMSQGLSLADLINEGSIGLIKATEDFDETFGFRFMTYASKFVQGSILEALAEDSRIVRPPLNKVSTAIKIGKAVSLFEQMTERLPTQNELANLLEVSEEEIYYSVPLLVPHKSLNEPISEGSPEEKIDVLVAEGEPETDSCLMEESVKSDFMRVLKTRLPERSVEILKWRFGFITGFNLTHEEIGKKFDLNRESIRQIEEKSILCLKQSPGAMRMLRQCFPA